MKSPNCPVLLHVTLGLLRAAHEPMSWADVKRALTWIDAENISSINRSLVQACPVRTAEGWRVPLFESWGEALPEGWEHYIQASGNVLQLTPAGAALDLDELSRHLEGWIGAAAALGNGSIEYRLRRYGLLLEEAEVPVGDEVPLKVIFRILGFPQAWWKNLEEDWHEQIALDRALDRYR